MSLLLILTMAIALFAAVCAMSLRSLVHCALTLAVSFSAVAAVYLQLNAEFVGFTEILVYVGAIAILIVMAILLTRSGETNENTVLTSGWLAGVAVTVMVFVILGWAVLNSHALPALVAAAPQTTVKDIGDVLMTKYVIPLEVIALMLTAAMIGAVVIAFKEVPVRHPDEEARAHAAELQAAAGQPAAPGLQPAVSKGGAA